MRGACVCIYACTNVHSCFFFFFGSELCYSLLKLFISVFCFAPVILVFRYQLCVLFCFVLNTSAIHLANFVLGMSLLIMQVKRVCAGRFHLCNVLAQPFRTAGSYHLQFICETSAFVVWSLFHWKGYVCMSHRSYRN